MSAIFQTYTNALLADATYALGKAEQGDVTGATSDRLTGYLSERMTPILAKYIGDNFTVVTHIETPDVGVDCSVGSDYGQLALRAEKPRHREERRRNPVVASEAETPSSRA